MIVAAARPVLSVVPAIALLALVACGAGETTDPSASTVAIWTDSVRVQLPADQFLASPGGILPLASGGFVVSDAGSGRLLIIGADGLLERVIGSRGRGPGELLVPASLELLGDDELVVTDNPTARLARFRLSDGVALDAVRLPGPTTDIRRAPEGLWLATPSMEANSTHARWAASDGSITRSGTVPRVFVDHPRLARNLALPVLAARGDTAWVGLIGENSVHQYVGTAEHARAEVVFPRVRRRGVPLDNAAWLESEMSYEAELGAVSVMHAVGALADGRVAALHLDITARDDAFTQVVFLSVLDPRTGTGCIDLPITFTGEGLPVTRFTDRALYTIVLREDAAGEPDVWIQWLRLETLTC
jgi:hypothetical protein